MRVKDERETYAIDCRVRMAGIIIDCIMIFIGVVLK